jgi:hypothetical protein
MLLQKGVVRNNLDIYVFITVGMDTYFITTHITLFI